MTTICTDSRQLLTSAARTSAVRAACVIVATALYAPTSSAERAARQRLLTPAAMFTPRALAECGRYLAAQTTGDAALALSHAADACDRAASCERTAHTECAHSLRLASAALDRWRAGRVAT